MFLNYGERAPVESSRRTIDAAMKREEDPRVAEREREREIRPRLIAIFTEDIRRWRNTTRSRGRGRRGVGVSIGGATFRVFFVFPRLLAAHVGLATRLSDSPIIDIHDEDLWDSINILDIQLRCFPPIRYARRTFA